MSFVPQVLGHLLVQRRLEHAIGELLQQPVRPGQGQALFFWRPVISSLAAISSAAGAVLAEQHDEWAEGRRYLGLDVLNRSRLALITKASTTTEQEAMTPAALTA